MPETRIVEIVYGLGGYDPSKPRNNILEEVTREFSDEELADEANKEAMKRAGKMIDDITNLSQAKVFLKKLCRRLFKNGALP